MKDTLKAIWKKTAQKATAFANKEQFDGIRNKVTEIKESEKFNQIVDKTAEHLSKPKTGKQLATDAVIGAGLAAITGGLSAIPMALAWATAEGVATKKLIGSSKFKKFVEARRNRKNDGPQPQ